VPAVKNGRRIVVTSALPGEGKTFTSIHLALSIAAEIDTSVILVDADIIRPSVHTMLGVGQQRGIADWFEDNTIPLAKIVSSTNIDGLKVVTSGKWKPNPAESLASRTMAKFFDALSAEYPDSILVVDSPPLLPASESATLAKNMGQVVLVVGAGVTSQSQVSQALEMLEGEQTVSLVLNRSRNSSSYANYGY
jgi:exopolysaccharide/PEP-CTERM locus tyrosine autokinase